MLPIRTANVFYDSLLALVYPQPCAVCGASVESRALGVACAACWEGTRIFSETEPLCWKCGLPSLGVVPDESRELVRCRRCDDDAFTAARACGDYVGALRASVLALKREPHLCSKLRELLNVSQSRYPLNQATRIVPVPLHPRREKARRFNQAALIGRTLSRSASLPFDEVSLVRTGHTEQHRAGMDAKGRRETVKDVFVVRHPALISGERILLVDDVFTTGATVSSCARVLLDAGAAEVYVLTLARPIYV
ncbi:MAG TPA: ComF family protein [Pyrinomonadaceae bacterium]|nr:ComF family protein [Pyrinomonadaceae bacterium]